MSAPTTKAFHIDSLTLNEIEDIEAVIGQTFAEAGESGSLRLPYAIYWVAARREDPDVSWDDVKGLPMSTITDLTDGAEDTPLP